MKRKYFILVSIILAFISIFTIDSFAKEIIVETGKESTVLTEKDFVKKGQQISTIKIIVIIRLQI